MEINKKKLSRIGKNIQTVESQLEKQKQIVRDRLRMIYQEGDLFLVKVLFSADSYSDLLQRLKYMEMIMSYDSRNFKDYALRLDQLNREKRKLEEGRQSLQELEQAALKKVEELNKEKETKSRFLKKIMGQQVYLIQTRKELMKASYNLNDLISKLEEKRILGQKIGLDDVKGRLNWPASGKLLNRFGKKRDKKLGAFIVNNGVSLKVTKGTPVKSIFHGKVLYTGFLEGYGNLIIVGHGNNYHSLYGHLDKIKVSKGDLVKEGELLGKSGDSGSLEGETLYFELRHQGKPIEPMKWFRVAGK
jgi:septal ring factor EnvC (AmiA/AmiB activator)